VPQLLERVAFAGVDADEFAELPTIDYEREAGLDYAAAYAAGGRSAGRVL